MPSMYAIHAGDLRPITDGSHMVKYADDTHLVVPEVNSASCEDELKHIDKWATGNLRLNQAKTVKIPVLRPRSTLC